MGSVGLRGASERGLERALDGVLDGPGPRRVEGPLKGLPDHFSSWGPVGRIVFLASGVASGSL